MKKKNIPRPIINQQLLANFMGVNKSTLTKKLSQNYDSKLTVDDIAVMITFYEIESAKLIKYIRVLRLNNPDSVAILVAKNKIKVH